MPDETTLAFLPGSLATTARFGHNRLLPFYARIHLLQRSAELQRTPASNEKTSFFTSSSPAYTPSFWLFEGRAIV